MNIKENSNLDLEKNLPKKLVSLIIIDSVGIFYE